MPRLLTNSKTMSELATLATMNMMTRRNAITIVTQARTTPMSTTVSI